MCCTMGRGRWQWRSTALHCWQHSACRVMSSGCLHVNNAGCLVCMAASVDLAVLGAPTNPRLLFGCLQLLREIELHSNIVHNNVVALYAAFQVSKAGCRL